jgi:hypothetical protein
MPYQGTAISVISPVTVKIATFSAISGGLSVGTLSSVGMLFLAFKRAEFNAGTLP